MWRAETAAEEGRKSCLRGVAGFEWTELGPIVCEGGGEVSRVWSGHG